jgi:hypothetical protein
LAFLSEGNRTDLLDSGLFYKFRSFTLECLALLATCFVIDAVLTGIRNSWIEGRGSAQSS